MRAAMLGMCLIVIADASYAHECTPRLIHEAEFGTKQLGAKTTCPGIKPKEEQSCELREQGIVYGVSETLIVNKEILADSYRGRLPFGVAWGDKLESVVRTIDGITQGTPPLFVSADSDGFALSTDTCLTTGAGEPYALTFTFDGKRALTRVYGQILYP